MTIIGGLQRYALTLTGYSILDLSLLFRPPLAGVIVQAFVFPSINPCIVGYLGRDIYNLQVSQRLARYDSTKAATGRATCGAV